MQHSAPTTTYVGRLLWHSGPQLSFLLRLAVSLESSGVCWCRATPPQAFLGQVLRHWGLQLPFLLLAKLTEQDTHIAWGIPEAKLLEIGLIYKL